MKKCVFFQAPLFPAAYHNIQYPSWSSPKNAAQEFLSNFPTTHLTTELLRYLRRLSKLPLPEILGLTL